MRPEGQEGGREKREGEESGNEEGWRGERERRDRREARKKGEEGRAEGGVSLQIINILLFVSEHFSLKHRVRRAQNH